MGGLGLGGWGRGEATEGPHLREGREILLRGVQGAHVVSVWVSLVCIVDDYGLCVGGWLVVYLSLAVVLTSFSA